MTEVIDVDKEHPLPAGKILRAYQFDKDINEAVAAYLRTFNRLPDVVYRLRKQAFIEEP